MAIVNIKLMAIVNITFMAIVNIALMAIVNTALMTIVNIALMAIIYCNGMIEAILSSVNFMYLKFGVLNKTIN